jgi:hypothetical protein
MPEAIKDAMMSEWSRESILAAIQEGSKTVSLNGSRSGTHVTGRNFLAVNGAGAGALPSTGSASPTKHVHHHHAHKKPDASYGLINSLSTHTKLRKSQGHSPSPPSDTSRNSVTRAETLKRVLSGQAPPTGLRDIAAHSDASSESMVSYDFTASEVSFNPNAEMGRSQSLKRS